MMETETIDKLFLELSQFTTAITKRELELMKRIAACEKLLQAHQTRGNTTEARREDK